MEKVMLVAAIKKLDDKVLAKEVYLQQVEMDWPGLAAEVVDICKIVGLQNICEVNIGKLEIKEAIFFDHQKELKLEMKKYVKLENIMSEDLRKPQPYIHRKSLEFCRMTFRLRTHQFVCWANIP